MEFELTEAIEVLRQTPGTIRQMVGSLSPRWTESSGDADDWGAFDIVGHLLHGEETDWMERTRLILSPHENKSFKPFDRTAQFAASEKKSLEGLLSEFDSARQRNLEELSSLELKDIDLELKGVHPEFGEVTLRQLLSTWVVHDLNHIAQIARKMAVKYETNVGPWKAYLSILQ